MIELNHLLFKIPSTNNKFLLHHFFFLFIYLLAFAIFPCNPLLSYSLFFVFIFCNFFLLISPRTLFFHFILFLYCSYISCISVSLYSWNVIFSDFSCLTFSNYLLFYVFFNDFFSVAICYASLFFSVYFFFSLYANISLILFFFFPFFLSFTYNIALLCQQFLSLPPFSYLISSFFLFYFFILNFTFPVLILYLFLSSLFLYLLNLPHSLPSIIPHFSFISFSQAILSLHSDSFSFPSLAISISFFISPLPPP